MGGHRRSEAYLLSPVGRELVRSALVVKLASELDDEPLMLRAAGRVAELARLVLAGVQAPLPVEGPGFGEAVRRAYPARRPHGALDVFDEVDAEGEAA